VTEIRSYRRVFDLERRIYRIDEIRLNPAGVPVRGVLYLLVAVAASLVAAGLPVLGAPLRALPWFARDLALPAGAAAILTVVRIDGRTFHHSARAAVSFWIAPRQSTGLGIASRPAPRWRPESITFLPDGSDAVVRRSRYTGPGSVAVLVRHHTQVRERRLGSRREISLTAADSGSSLRRARVIALDRRTTLVVALDRRGGPG
jgi:hypothetical protein